MGNRRRALRLLGFGLVVAIGIVGKFFFDLYHLAGLPFPAMTVPVDDLGTHLKAHVDALSEKIGERNFDHPEALDAAARYIEGQFQSLGYKVALASYTVKGRDVPLRNIEARLPGSSASAPLLVIGAHYDTAPGTPGADDNSTGIAALIELARELKSQPRKAEIRFVAFGTEEPPSFGTADMGSAHYAQSLPVDRPFLGMMSLECLGFYREEAGSQKYPWPLSWFFPDRGNFVGVVSNMASRGLLRQFRAAYPESDTKAIFVAFPQDLVSAITLSDQFWFWKRSLPAVMITDTAFLRNPTYHQSSDRGAHLNYQRFSDVVLAVGKAVERIANGPTAVSRTLTNH